MTDFEADLPDPDAGETPEETSLGWGQTPLDALTHIELLRVSQRLYAALLATQSALKVARSASQINPDLSFIERTYWTTGDGAAALEKARQAIAAVDGEADEPAYAGFYRYANSLLFAGKEHWALCSACKSLFTSAFEPVGSFDGQPCHTPGCDGVLHSLTWADLQPGTGT